MAPEERTWRDEVERRATIYDLPQHETGRLGPSDYTAMLALTLVITGLFWMWAV